MTHSSRRRRRTLDAVLASVIGLLCVLPACGNQDVSTADATKDTLTGTSWILRSWVSAGGRTVDAAGDATLEFDRSGHLAGSTGCNSFTGGYSVDGNTVTIRLGAMTQMACVDPAVTAQEQGVVAGLPLVERWSTTGTTLTLFDSSGRTLFTYTTVPSGLSGTSWTARGVNNGRGALETTADTEKLTLKFGADGTVSGFSGCNTFSGRYASTPPAKIAISALATTKMMCTPEAMQLETEYLAALTTATTYRRSGTTLNLRDDSGATQADFKLDSGG